MNRNVDKLCCVNCFSEIEIQRFIEEFDEIGDCDYCGSEEIYVCEVDEVGEFIQNGIDRYYEDAARMVSYDSAEGGYLLPTMDIHDILLYEQEIFSDVLEDPIQLADDLIPNDGTPYVRRNPYSPESGLEQFKTWKEFGDFIKHSQRFTAFLDTENNAFDETHPRNFFNTLADRIKALLVELYPGMKIYRARIIDGNFELNHKNLTSPPVHETKNNRMSPAGISLFYGGKEEDVCIAEVRPDVGEYVAVAEFEMLKNLKVLDLSVDFDAPKSIFSDDYTFEYEEYFKPFFSHFVSDIAKPIRPADSGVDYIPTQVFAEFIRMYRFKDWDIGNIFSNEIQPPPSTYEVNGLMFKSSLIKDGKNIVLFKGPEISTEQVTSENAAWLLYKGFKKHEITEIKVFHQETKESDEIPTFSERMKEMFTEHDEYYQTP